jgi:pilus assembly protein Flp/PilA
MNIVTLTVLKGIAETRLWLRGRASSERGAAAVEYGLLVALIALVIIGVVFALGGTLSGLFGHTSNVLNQYY